MDHFTPRSQSPAALPSLPSQPKRSKSNSADLSFKENMILVTEATMFNFGTQEVPVDLTNSPVNSSRVQLPPPIPSNNVRPSAPSKTLPPQCSSGVKKIQIQNLHKPTRNNADRYFHTTWESLSTALTAIFNRERIPMSLEGLYRGVENICRAGRAPELFSLLNICCKDYVSAQLKPKIIQAVGNDVIQVARVVNAEWTQWEKQLVAMSLVLQWQLLMLRRAQFARFFFTLTAHTYCHRQLKKPSKLPACCYFENISRRAQNWSQSCSRVYLHCSNRTARVGARSPLTQLC